MRDYWSCLNSRERWLSFALVFFVILWAITLAARILAAMLLVGAVWGIIAGILFMSLTSENR